MKKSIQKPVNWQDFESLCKMLFGEVWGIPLKIKKNGRSGQPQAGVDISGIPKNELNYWGIQCKGKEGGLNSKLTKKEIDEEIKKAQIFNPKLEVFIFATTMQKDTIIEEYIRIQDIESRENGGFEVLLFCWEDISDLIEENRNTYNFWVKNQQHVSNFDFEVSFDSNSNKELTIHPKWLQIINRYRLKKYENIGTNSASAVLMKSPSYQAVTNFQRVSQALQNSHKPEIDKTVCEFELILNNIGSEVIEDWHIIFEFYGDFKNISVDNPNYKINFLFRQPNLRLSVNENTVSYYTLKSEPLIQKDSIRIKLFITPNLETKRVPIKWKMLARNFDIQGELAINVSHNFIPDYRYIYVESKKEILKDEVIDIVPKILNKNEDFEDDDSDSILHNL